MKLSSRGDWRRILRLAGRIVRGVPWYDRQMDQVVSHLRADGWVREDGSIYVQPDALRKFVRACANAFWKAATHGDLEPNK